MERANPTLERTLSRYDYYCIIHLIYSDSVWESEFDTWQGQNHVVDFDESLTSSWISPWKNTAEFIGNVVTPFILNPSFVCSLVEDYFGELWGQICPGDFEL